MYIAILFNQSEFSILALRGKYTFDLCIVATDATRRIAVDYLSRWVRLDGKARIISISFQSVDKSSSSGRERRKRTQAMCVCVCMSLCQYV